MCMSLVQPHQEDPRRTLYFSYLFIGDHLINTIWTVIFAVLWWVYNPHDGKRIANSEAQKDMMGASHMTDEERKQAAQLIWNKEKGFAATVLVLGWLSKVGRRAHRSTMCPGSESPILCCCYQFYFAALLYSYAVHLRRGSYRDLPLSQSQPDPKTTAPFLSTSALATAADEYELDNDIETTFQQDVPRRPTGLSRHH